MFCRPNLNKVLYNSAKGWKNKKNRGKNEREIEIEKDQSISSTKSGQKQK